MAYAGKTAADAIERANTFNASSKSNGSLMRSMPHAIFGANMVKAGKFRELKTLVAGEAKFVHANKIVHEAIFVYIAAMAHLLNNPDDSKRGQAAFDLALKLSKEELANTVDMQYGESVNKWLMEAKALAD
jgi:ADP-ribosylglycohydrolase